jgi:cysteinyl-tRNA synthetase
MSDYFGYDIHFVMNITDIDDKVVILTGSSSLRIDFAM